jgi:hypothetical protein
MRTASRGHGIQPHLSWLAATPQPLHRDAPDRRTYSAPPRASGVCPCFPCNGVAEFSATKQKTSLMKKSKRSETLCACLVTLRLQPRCERERWNASEPMNSERFQRLSENAVVVSEED